MSKFRIHFKRCRLKCTVSALYSQDLRDKHAHSFVYAVADYFLVSVLMPARKNYLHNEPSSFLMVIVY